MRPLTTTLLFFLLLGAALWWQDKQVTAHWKAYYFTADPPAESLYFVGSSRIRQGISPEVIAACQPAGTKVYNMGAARTNLYHTSLLAAYIMDQPGRKTLYLEFSKPSRKILLEPLIAMRDLGVRNTSSFLDVLRSTAGYQQRLQVVEAYLQYLVSQCNIRSILKISLFPDSEQPPYYHKTNHANKYDRLDSYLREEDLLPLAMPQQDMLLTSLVTALVEKAERTDTKLFFLLPLTVLSDREREWNSKHFRSLPDSLRFDYTPEQIRSIRKTEYLLDQNHFNIYGAKVWSSFFCDTGSR
ncbi:MAG: hypothetical protein RLY31_2126 [Bacteroidota bacterium]|jgi:hypothetical protein